MTTTPTVAPSWAEGFTTLSLVTPANPGALWYANPNSPVAQVGVKDPAGTTWDAHPAQKFSNGVTLNPFLVAPVTDARGMPSVGNALTIVAKNSTPAEQAACGFPVWGGTVVTNADAKVFTVGCYVEIRALFRGMGTNLWPAIWFFAAAGVQAGVVNPGPYQGAEVDLCEPQGHLSPGWVSLHMRQTADAPNPNFQYHGSSDINGASFYGYPVVENTWANYGFDWQADALTFYLNGTQVAQMTDGVVLSYFRAAKMACRLDYTMQAGAVASGAVSLSVDSIAQWPSFAASRAAVIPPPTPTLKAQIHAILVDAEAKIDALLP